MKIVIQCAAKKAPSAGHIQTNSGKPILFVAQPDLAPTDSSTAYFKPDDSNENGISWREYLTQYNQNKSNPLNLLPAYKLYMNKSYQDLVTAYGLKNIFILSAGWGLINAEFLTPNYDITFSASAEKYKRRNKSDNYLDYSLLPIKENDDLIFLGGKDYLPLFVKLSEQYSGKRIIYYNSNKCPVAKGCELIRFKTKTRTNWHYGCAKSLIENNI